MTGVTGEDVIARLARKARVLELVGSVFKATFLELQIEDPRRARDAPLFARDQLMILPVTRRATSRFYVKAPGMNSAW